MAKLWNTKSGECEAAFKGHQAEVVCLDFKPDNTQLATGSMDGKAKLWDVKTARVRCNLEVSLIFSHNCY